MRKGSCKLFQKYTACPHKKVSYLNKLLAIFVKTMLVGVWDGMHKF